MIDLAPLIDVTDIRVLSRYVVELAFADGDVRMIDFFVTLAQCHDARYPV